MTCLFCKIVAKEIPAKIVYEDEQTIAFDDISPQAPTHTLIIPKIHIENVNDLNSDHQKIMSGLFLTAQKVAKLKNLSQKGYRLIINNGASAGQEIFHLHLHLLGGAENLGPILNLNAD